jgi:hypothetical protein
MNALSKVTSPAITGAITVALATFLPGLVISYCSAYLSSEPNWKFGRDGEFQVSLFILFWLTICNVAAFLSTVCFYYWWRIPRTILRVVLHAAVGAIFASACFYFGLPMHLAPLLPHGTLSNNGVTEIIVLTTLVALLPFFLILAFHLATIRACRHKTEPLTSQST